ncbi:cadmium-translocating P-type ATPase [Rhodovulum sp. 12E13]|nr:heavy metal translocating P-type ATPase [Rhodovulum sp. 12E13]RDC74171.1 cadmium-translocating P-type ATPase [Rhodovulum sp. 12E13]
MARRQAAAAAGEAQAGRVMLSLPEIRCAGCISGVEKALAAEPGVRSARVNFTLKRATVETDPGVTPARLVAALDRAGHAAHELDASALSMTETDRAGRDLLMRLAVAGFAAMNVMLLSVAVWSGAADATRDLFHWISAAIAIPAVIFSGRPFYVSAWGALRKGRLNMDVPITLAIVLAVGTSLWETSLSGKHAYFDAAIALVFFLLGGRYLDHRTRAVARSAAEELAALEVPRAWRVAEGREEEVRVGDLAAGDLVRVKPGGRMPVDGEIVAGTSELDRGLLTGETRPVFAGPGQAVSAGEVNLTGPLEVRVTAAGRESSLHRMADLVAVAESAKNRYTSLADRAAGLYAPGVHILSALAGIGWWLYTGDLRLALNIAAAVLIITCPCALGLAVPAVTTAASGRLFRHGLLIKDGTALERLAEVDTVLFDKTGTLTLGTPEVTGLDAHARDDLALARALAEGSAHPLSRALAEAVAAQGIAPVTLEAHREVPGYGAEAIWQGRTVRLGRADWVGAAPGETTAAWLGVEGRAPVAFTFADRLRPGAREAVDGLKAAGLQVALVSGDAAPAVARFAASVGIDDWTAEVLPEGKAARVEALHSGGAKVLFVGDGLNDTAALAAAHASISPATALDAARTASDIVLLGADIAPLAGAVTTARSAVRRIRENFAIATWYNVIAVPIAIAGFATPLAAALAMSASSLTVSLNALRVR